MPHTFKSRGWCLWTADRLCQEKVPKPPAVSPPNSGSLRRLCRAPRGHPPSSEDASAGVSLLSYCWTSAARDCGIVLLSTSRSTRHTGWSLFFLRKDLPSFPCTEVDSAEHPWFPSSRGWLSPSFALPSSGKHWEGEYHPCTTLHKCYKRAQPNLKCLRGSKPQRRLSNGIVLSFEASQGSCPWSPAAIPTSRLGIMTC